MPAVIETVQLEERQISEAADVLARAFFDDPLMAFIDPDDEHRRRALPPFMRTAVVYGHRFGQAYTSAGAPDGVAVWQTPDSGEITAEQMQDAGMAEATAALGEAASSRFVQCLDFLGGLRARDVTVRHWYLMLLGVEPARQRQGIGGQLIQPVLQRADAGAVRCYLETMKARNVPFYRKHGFEVVQEGTLPGGGPRFWTMLRRPRA